MSVDDIVSLVSSKGAQLKLAEKRRQLSTLKPGLAMRESTPTVSVFVDGNLLLL